LGSLKQLRVLVLHGTGGRGSIAAGDALWQWLEHCSRQMLPPQLQLLGVPVCSAPPGLQQHLGRSGIEVVDGADLDEVCDPVKQLAGLPVALQQALV
jgi:hypothetical protein